MRRTLAKDARWGGARRCSHAHNVQRGAVASGCGVRAKAALGEAVQRRWLWLWDVGAAERWSDTSSSYGKESQNRDQI